MSISSRVPVARFDDLILTESGDDLLVYDQSTHGIHHLNSTSATIWKLCDGENDVESIGLQAGVTPAQVRSHLDQLTGVGLLVAGSWSVTAEATSRRRFLKRAAVAGAVAAPVVISMTAPNAAGAVSTFCTPSPCLMDFDCEPGCICAAADAQCVAPGI